MTRLSALTIVTLSVAGPATASVTFSDSTFSNSDYTTTLYSAGAAIGTQGQIASGNPGSSYQADATITTPDASGVLALATNNNFVYDPGTQGAISTIDFSLDRYAKFTLTDPNGLSSDVNIGSYTLRLLASQAGKTYQANFAFGPFNAPGGFWNPLSQGGIVASNFSELTLANFATGGGATGLDFSNGAITFGFAMRGAGFGVPGTFNYDLRADNFVVTVNSAIPEPQSWLLMIAGFGILGLALRMQRPGRAIAVE